MKKFCCLFLVFLFTLTLTACGINDEEVEKPVIYLYPNEVTEVDVELEYDGDILVTYPLYHDGWEVVAKPDGQLVDKEGLSYNYLYWEGSALKNVDFSKGFCIKGEDTAKFLEDTLKELGLNRKEANEFIIYWLARMQNNPYNVISFQEDNYLTSAKLNVNPQPDTEIRICMAWYPSDEFVEIPLQTFDKVERHGFTLVEWGGMEVKH